MIACFVVIVGIFFFFLFFFFFFFFFQAEDGIRDSPESRGLGDGYKRQRKGFAAAILGGLGSGPGAVLGGLALGLLESLSAGYVSSAYKDVIAFGIMLAVLVLMPGGLLGRRSAERV